MTRAHSPEELAAVAARWVAPRLTEDGRPCDSDGIAVGLSFENMVQRFVSLPEPFLASLAAVPETSTERAVRGAIAQFVNRQWLQLQPGTPEYDTAKRALGDTLAIIDILDAIIATETNIQHDLWPAAHSNSMHVRESYASPDRAEPRLYPNGKPEHGYVMATPEEKAKFRAFALLWLILSKRRPPAPAVG